LARLYRGWMAWVAALVEVSVPIAVPLVMRQP
jgi:hypothetical protein